MEHRRTESLGEVREEIVAEMAAALGRIARVLEHHIERLHGLLEEISAARDTERQRGIATFHRVRAEAERYLWYLRVQREVVGFVDRGELERHYRIPVLLESPDGQRDRHGC